MRAVAYLRVSTDKQVREGVSLDNQQKRVTEYAGYKGFDLVRIIRDEGKSGGCNGTREGFIDLLDMIERGEAEAVVLYSLERLSRDMLTLLALERLLDEYGVELHTVEGAVDTGNPDGWMSFAMRAFLGEMERRQVKYRTQKAMEHCKRQGKVVGSVPYGYRRVEEGLVEDVREQAVIRMANKLYSGGASLTEVARALNAKGLRTRASKPFALQQVKRLLSSYREVYQRRNSGMGRDIRHFITRIA